jgi:ADP-ribose pyrophosphatase YjhB (NUDIX family)
LTPRAPSSYPPPRIPDNSFSERPVSRYFATDPHEVRLSVSAVVWRDADRRELLLMQRSDNAHWGLPGGYVEAGESVQIAAVREVAEETGVQVSIGRLVGVYSDPAMQVIEYPDGRRVHAINLCFEADPVAIGVASTPDEVLATGYFAPDALPDPLVPIHRVRIADAVAGGIATRVR